VSDKTSLAQALAKLDEAMRPSLGGSNDPARRRAAQRLAQLARCEDEDLPVFARRHMPGRAVEESELRTARDLLLAIGGIADMEEGGPDAWVALAEVKQILERRVAEAKEAALARKAEAEKAALSRKAEAEEVALRPPEPVMAFAAAQKFDEVAIRPPELLISLAAVQKLEEVAIRPPEPVLNLTATQELGYAVPEDSDAWTTLAVDQGPRGPALPFNLPDLPWAQGPRPGVSEPPKLDASPPAHGDLSNTREDLQLPTMDPVLPFRRPVEEPRARPPAPPPPLTAPPPPPLVEPAPRAFVAEPLNVLSLAQYASLCAELTVFPEKSEEIFWRYGLDTSEKRSAVDAVWKERLRHERAVYDAWQELYRRYRAHWMSQGTPP
jgi:hypothetical protein